MMRPIIQHQLSHRTTQTTMYKLVLCAFLAVAVAEPEPGVAWSAPWAGYSTIVSPSTSFIRTASSVIQPAPIIYNAAGPYTHFIKKRSPQWPLGYIQPNTYLASGPVVSSSFAVPTTSVLPAVPLTYSTTHLIKKRSPGFLSTPWIAPATYSAPLLTSYAAGSHYIPTSPVLSHPVAYSAHLIKKRSAPLLSTYLAPAAYSHTSRFDLNQVSPIGYPSPYLYPSVIGGPVVIAK